MTSLSSTLPGDNQNSSSRRPQNPSKQHSPDIADDSQNIIEAFQSAARSVTHLYRSSAALIRSSRTDGYTDALSDVLEAIDNESAYNDPSLALSRIRDWVIDRRHEMKGGVANGNATGRSESMPPQQQREMSTESEMDDGANNNGNGKEEEQQRREDARQDVPHSDLQHQQHLQMNVQSIPQFSFQPLNPLPQYPSQTQDVVEPLQSPGVDGIFMFNSPVTTQQMMPNGRTSGAGNKRRNQSVDFFDIGGFGNFGMNGTPGRDFGNWGSGGGGGGGGQGNAKRGKFV
ncbi:hypothetical protein TWF191_000588 [Orbilia oligospora]|uniref:Uncharacterized protein n=1 Tax=Orbilia oligospora TaxID=2813651 RepID=A0A7C8QEN1_ORBOL|nr:hypothetical protein TWF191_000588 [Orbilia oligospora]